MRSLHSAIFGSPYFFATIQAMVTPTHPWHVNSGPRSGRSSDAERPSVERTRILPTARQPYLNEIPGYLVREGSKKTIAPDMARAILEQERAAAAAQALESLKQPVLPRKRATLPEGAFDRSGLRKSP